MLAHHIRTPSELSEITITGRVAWAAALSDSKPRCMGGNPAETWRKPSGNLAETASARYLNAVAAD